MNFLKLQDLLKRYNIQRPAFWRWRKNLGFPASITPERTRPMWRLTDVEEWEQNNFVKGDSQ
jgi:predicted DNA-binding transcriptional regulator AlpA